MINKEFAHKTIMELVQNGLERMKDNNLNEQGFSAWFEYSQKILELVTKDNPTILLNYLRLSLSFHDGQRKLAARDKLSLCLEYLLEMLKVI